MSNGIVRVGDVCSGHGGYPPRPAITGSPDVSLNGSAVVRVGDSWAVHCDDDDCHMGTSITGSSTVFVNGIPVCRVGDQINCGSTMVSGSTDGYCG